MKNKFYTIIITAFLAATFYTTSFSQTMLFTEGFENCPVGVTTVPCNGWAHGDDNYNASGSGCPPQQHNGADIDQPNSNYYPALHPPTGYHRVFDSNTIPVHSGNKALKFLSDDKVGCKLASTKSITPVPGQGNIEIVDVWFMIPNNWQTGTITPPNRSSLYSITISNNVYMRIFRDDTTSTNYRWTLEHTPSGKVTLGFYPITPGVWHHIQSVCDLQNFKFIDVVLDGISPFGPLSVSIDSAMTWDALLIVEPVRNVAGGECECVDTNGFHATTYFDDFTVIQAQSWPTTTATNEYPNGNAQVFVYSDPSTDYVNVTLSGINFSSEKPEFTVYNLCGRAVKKMECSSSSFTVNKSALSNGMYIYELKNSKEVMAKGKFIIK